MTDEQARALGERWVKAGGAEVNGMLLRYGDSLKPMDTHRVGGHDNHDDSRSMRPSPWWPDLRDPAARGAALEVVRKRWGDPSAHVRPSAQARVPWAFCASTGFVYAATEAEALVTALEATQ